MRLRLAVALVLISTALCACKSEKDEAARAEAGRVAHQIDLLRSAATEEKPTLRKLLEQTACSVPDVCAVKQACSEAYAVRERAMDALASVHHAIGQAGDLPQGTSLVLSEAEADVKRSGTLTLDCAKQETAMSERYKF
ncbi:MAG TPA: hypothetical protein VH062_22125 [Polyangiaceae bacterium]|nr:hypothetical protein [Polyangiaceae bacterium]